MNIFKILLVTMIGFLLSACGGGGSSTSSSSSGSSGTTETVTGVELPESMSVVTAEESSATSGVLLGAIADTSGFASDSHYNTDETRTYVFDPSMESLSTVNMILCLLDQTRASDMVNEGAYYALIDEDKCEQGSNKSGGAQAGQSSNNANATEYNKWTIQATRADNDSPMIVKAWVPGDEESYDSTDEESRMDDIQNILVEVTATEGKSTTNPYGKFTMNFKGVIDTGLASGSTASNEFATMMTGTLATVDNAESKPQFEFINLGGTAVNSSLPGSFSFEQATSVILDDATGTTGSAKTKDTFSEGSFSEDFSFSVAFNDTHLMRAKDSGSDGVADAEVCVDRNEFATQVWRYNLYNSSTGARVTLNSGFPFRYDTGTEIIDGHIGYWGIWTHNEEGLPNGATIEKMDFGSDTTTEYTVNVSPGKLIKRSRSEVALSKYQGDQFYGWYNHPTLGEPQSSSFDNWVISVDTNNDFVISGGVTWGQTGPIVTDFTDQTITLTDGDQLWLWSDALGGNVVYIHDPAVTDATLRTVSFFDEEFVNPDNSMFSSGAVTLNCYHRCLKGGLSADDIAAASSEWDLFYSEPTTGYHQYTLSNTGNRLVLTDNQNSDAVVTTDGLDLTSLGIEWGMQSDAMVIDVSSIPDDQRWSLNQQDVSYRWETGSNQWNKLVTVSDANGDIASFDKPMRFTYTLEAGDDVNGDDSDVGKTFMVEYGGPGELWGFPWEPEEGCEPSPETHCRWYAAVTLKNGVILNDGTSDYVVKQIEGEQVMQEVDAANCGTLDAASLLTDTSLTLPTSSDIGTVSFAWTDKPTPASAAPAVVEGELQ